MQLLHCKSDKSLSNIVFHFYDACSPIISKVDMFVHSFVFHTVVDELQDYCYYHFTLKPVKVEMNICTTAESELKSAAIRFAV